MGIQLAIEGSEKAPLPPRAALRCSVTRSPSSPERVTSDQDMASGHREAVLGGCYFVERQSPHDT